MRLPEKNTETTALAREGPNMDWTEEFWNDVLTELSWRMSKDTYQWLHGTKAIGFNDPTLTIGAPTEFTVGWIGHRLRRIIEDTMALVSEGRVTCLAVVLLDPAERGPVASDPPAPDYRQLWADVMDNCKDSGLRSDELRFLRADVRIAGIVSNVAQMEVSNPRARMIIGAYRNVLTILLKQQTDGRITEFVIR